MLLTWIMTLHMMINMNRLIVAIALFSITAIPCHSDTTEIVQHNAKKVVMIITFDDNDQPLSIGSGFYISGDGLILTNYHVIENAASALVRGTDSDERLPVAKVVMIGPDYDLAIIQVKTISNSVSLGDDISLQVGEKIIAIGNPEGLQGTVSEGIISGFRKIDEEFRIIQITAPISPGSSGGPLFNKDGEVVGVTTAYLSSGQNLNFAIPIHAMDLMKKRGKLLNQALGELNYSAVTSKMLQKTPGDMENRVNVGDYDIDYIFGYITFSIQNQGSRSIRNIKLITEFYPYSSAKSSAHFEAYLVEDEIPSGLTKQVKKLFNAKATFNWVARFRILDYEILPTSGQLQFR